MNLRALVLIVAGLNLGWGLSMFVQGNIIYFLFNSIIGLGIIFLVAYIDTFYNIRR